MSNPFGFMEYERQDAPASSALERIRNYNEFHTPLSAKEQQKQGEDHSLEDHSVLPKLAESDWSYIYSRRLQDKMEEARSKYQKKF